MSVQRQSGCCVALHCHFHSNSPYANLKRLLYSGYVMDAITTNVAGTGVPATGVPLSAVPLTIRFAGRSFYCPPEECDNIVSLFTGPHLHSRASRRHTGGGKAINP